MQKCTGPFHPTGHRNSGPWRALAWLLRGMGAAGSSVLSLGPHSRLDARQPCLLLTALSCPSPRLPSLVFQGDKIAPGSTPSALSSFGGPPPNALKSENSAKVKRQPCDFLVEAPLHSPHLPDPPAPASPEQQLSTLALYHSTTRHPPRADRDCATSGRLALGFNPRTPRSLEVYSATP